MWIILAHGGLGFWDDITFLGIAIIFTGFMGISWWRSRDFEDWEDYYDDEE